MPEDCNIVAKGIHKRARTELTLNQTNYIRRFSSSHRYVEYSKAVLRHVLEKPFLFSIDVYIIFVN